MIKGILASVMGTSGTAKSSFARSMAMEGSIKVACLPGSEADTYTGRDGQPLTVCPHTGESYNSIEVMEFDNPEFLPLMDVRKAPAFRELFRKVQEWRKEKPYGIIIDSGTGVSDIIAEMICAENGVDKMRFQSTDYPQFTSLYLQFVRVLRACTNDNINVLFTFHPEFKELTGSGEPTKTNVGTTNAPKFEMQFEEALMPQVHGKLRERLLGQFSLNLRSFVVGGAKPQYYLSALPGKTDMSRSRYPIKDERKARRIDPYWRSLLEVI